MTYCPTNPPPPPPPFPFFAECVIVCDKYSDFLGKTLPHNKYLFNRIVVVTSPEDRETQRVCEYWHVECIQTDLLQSRWKKFCKGCGINVGLAKLSKAGWVFHLDADILLPPQTKLLLEQADLDPAMLYGIDRFNLRGYETYAGFIDNLPLQQECNTYIHMNAFPVGTRIMHAHQGGYVPLGFFQMWNPKVSGVSRYPEQASDAGMTDTLFAGLWPRRKRSLIPEIVAYHLESSDAHMAANWAGRVTAPFTHGGR